MCRDHPPPGASIPPYSPPGDGDMLGRRNADDQRPQVTELSGYALETLREGSEYILYRGRRSDDTDPILGSRPCTFGRRPQISGGSSTNMRSRASSIRLGGATPRARAPGRPHDARARGPRRRSPRAHARPAAGADALPAPRHRADGSARPGPPARPHPQGHQAGKRARRRRRQRLADRLRHRLPAAARAPGARAPGSHRRHVRLHGARADRPHEPLDRRPQRSLLARRHVLRDADRRAAVHGVRSDGVDPLPHRPAAAAAERAGATSIPDAGRGDRHEAARQDRRGPLPDRRRASRPTCAAA